MAKVSQQTIDLIKNTADIVDVVGEFVPLHPAGKNMKGLCPFHSEKTPSFFVSKERQIFNCFGCGEKGNAITFIEKYKNLTFMESLKFLADKYHIDLEYDEEFKKTNTTGNLYSANELALKFYQLNLLNMTSGKEALSYLTQRGLDLQTIEEFEIGYAPSTGFALFNQLSKDYQPLDLLNAGLINKGNTDYYDLFRGRIMFPIRDESSRVVAFSGRIFGNQDNPAKYVNTSQTEIFQKSEILYNLHNAIPHIRRNNRVVLMEGYMDVIKASKALVKEVICSMGTQLTIEQALKIKKYTDNVIICYDGDQAGKQATYKAIKLLENAKLNVKILPMPDGIDPDEFISNNPNFNEYLDNNTYDQYEFVYSMITTGKDLTKPSEIEIVKNKLFDFFQNTSVTIREIYLNKFSADTLIDIETIKSDYNQTQINQRITNSIKTQIKSRPKAKKHPKYKKAEIAIINYYFYDAKYRNIVDNLGDNIYFETEHRSLMLSAQEANKTYTTGSFLVAVKSSLTEKSREQLDSLLYPKYYDFTEEEFQDCIKTLLIAKLNDEINFIQEQVLEAKQLGDKSLVLELEMKILNIKIKQNEISEGRQNEQTANYRKA